MTKQIDDYLDDMWTFTKGTKEALKDKGIYLKPEGGLHDVMEALHFYYLNRMYSADNAAYGFSVLPMELEEIKTPGFPKANDTRPLAVYNNTATLQQRLNTVLGWKEKIYNDMKQNPVRSLPLGWEPTSLAYILEEFKKEPNFTIPPLGLPEYVQVSEENQQLTVPASKHTTVEVDNGKFITNNATKQVTMTLSPHEAETKVSFTYKTKWGKLIGTYLLDVLGWMDWVPETSFTLGLSQKHYVNNGEYNDTQQQTYALNHPKDVTDVNDPKNTGSIRIRLNESQYKSIGNSGYLKVAVGSIGVYKNTVVPPEQREWYLAGIYPIKDNKNNLNYDQPFVEWPVTNGFDKYFNVWINTQEEADKIEENMARYGQAQLYNNIPETYYPSVDCLFKPVGQSDIITERHMIWDNSSGDYRSYITGNKHSSIYNELFYKNRKIGLQLFKGNGRFNPQMLYMFHMKGQFNSNYGYSNIPVTKDAVYDTTDTSIFDPTGYTIDDTMVYRTQSIGGVGPLYKIKKVGITSTKPRIIDLDNITSQDLPWLDDGLAPKILDVVVNNQCKTIDINPDAKSQDKNILKLTDTTYRRYDLTNHNTSFDNSINNFHYNNGATSYISAHILVTSVDEEKSFDFVNTFDYEATMAYAYNKDQTTYSLVYPGNIQKVKIGNIWCLVLNLSFSIAGSSLNSSQNYWNGSKWTGRGEIPYTDLDNIKVFFTKNNNVLMNDDQLNPAILPYNYRNRLLYNNKGYKTYKYTGGGLVDFRKHKDLPKSTTIIDSYKGISKLYTDNPDYNLSIFSQYSATQSATVYPSLRGNVNSLAVQNSPINFVFGGHKIGYILELPYSAMMHTNNFNMTPYRFGVFDRSSNNANNNKLLINKRWLIGTIFNESKYPVVPELNDDLSIYDIDSPKFDKNAAYHMWIRFYRIHKYFTIKDGQTMIQGDHAGLQVTEGKVDDAIDKNVFNTMKAKHPEWVEFNKLNLNNLLQTYFRSYETINANFYVFNYYKVGFIKSIDDKLLPLMEKISKKKFNDLVSWLSNDYTSNIIDTQTKTNTCAVTPVPTEGFTFAKRYDPSYTFHESPLMGIAKSITSPITVEDAKRLGTKWLQIECTLAEFCPNQPASEFWYGGGEEFPINNLPFEEFYTKWHIMELQQAGFNLILKLTGISSKDNKGLPDWVDQTFRKNYNLNGKSGSMIVAENLVVTRNQLAYNFFAPLTTLFRQVKYSNAFRVIDINLFGIDDTGMDENGKIQRFGDEMTSDQQYGRIMDYTYINFVTTYPENASSGANKRRDNEASIYNMGTAWRNIDIEEDFKKQLHVTLVGTDVESVKSVVAKQIDPNNTKVPNPVNNLTSPVMGWDPNAHRPDIERYYNIAYLSKDCDFTDPKWTELEIKKLIARVESARINILIDPNYQRNGDTPIYKRLKEVIGHRLSVENVFGFRNGSNFNPEYNYYCVTLTNNGPAPFIINSRKSTQTWEGQGVGEYFWKFTYYLEYDESSPDGTAGYCLDRIPGGINIPPYSSVNLKMPLKMGRFLNDRICQIYNNERNYNTYAYAVDPSFVNIKLEIIRTLNQGEYVEREGDRTKIETISRFNNKHNDGETYIMLV